MKTAQTYISLLLLVIFLSHHIQGQVVPQQNIRGTVFDADTQTPIVGATVSIPLLQKGTYTDEEGNFTLPAIPVGRHTIQVIYLGYETASLNQIQLTSAKELILNVPLNESIVQMETVVIEAEDDKVSPINELSVVSTRTFSVEETKRFAGAINDPSRMASAFAGVSTGEFDEENEIVIRGNSPRGLLWRLEGVEVPSPNHFTDQGASSGAVSIISSNLLANSDFSTGAFSSEYGNALSGVFDIQLRKGNNQQREYAFEAGVIGVDFAAEGPFKKGYGGSYLINYRYSTLAILNQLGIKIVGDSDIRFQDLSFKLHLPTKKFGNFSIFGIGGLSAQSEFEEGILGNGQNGRFWEEAFDSDMGVIGLKHRILLGEKTVINSGVSFNIQRVTYDYLEPNNEFTLSLEEEEDFNNYATRMQTTLTHKFNARHLIKVGAIYSDLGYKVKSAYYDREENRNITEVDEQGNAGVLQTFAHWRFRLGEKLSLNSGFHVLHFDLNKETTFEPRASLKYQLSPKSYLSAGFGIHSRREGISLYLARQQQDNGDFIQANKNLEFTKARHYVLSYDHMLGERLHLRTELYYQDLYDVPVVNEPNTVFSAINFEGGFTTVDLINAGTGSNYGLELTLEKFFSRSYYFLLTSSLYESRYQALNGVEYNTRYNGNFINNFLVGKEFKSGDANVINANIRGIWSGGKRFTPVDLELSRENGFTTRDWNRIFETRTPDYIRIDMSTSYTVNKPKLTHTFKLEIQNVLNRSNVRDEFYSSFTDGIVQDLQGSIIPVLSYKVNF